MKTISQFIDNNFLHFNSYSLKTAAQAYKAHIKSGRKMMITMAGAMSTAEIGKTLAEMIRTDQVHAISCTGANLEEDIFNLVAHDHYEKVFHWRSLTAEDEQKLYEKGFNRVTDVCIPEEEAIRKIEGKILEKWQAASKQGEAYFPHQYFFQILKNGGLKSEYQIDPKNSWMLAAMEKNLPIFVPGWEDSTLGNIFAAHMSEGEIKPECLKTGVHYMVELASWYRANAKSDGIGFFQIGGGIAGDFPICVVPMLTQDLKQDIPMWNYFCQISDSTTSYGSYSGATPNEKITWGKLSIEAPKFIIESDASIVAPLMFAYILGW